MPANCVLKVNHQVSSQGQNNYQDLLLQRLVKVSVTPLGALHAPHMKSSGIKA